MNAPISTTILSPAIGEAHARLDSGTPVRSLSEILAALPLASSALLQRLSRVLDLPASGIATIACSAELLIDLSIAAAMPDGRNCVAWRDATATLVSDLEQVTVTTQSHDRIGCIGLKLSRAQILLTTPCNGHAEHVTRALRALRARLIVNHAELNRPLSVQAVRLFAALMEGRREGQLGPIVDELTPALSDLRLLRERLPPNCPEYRLLSQLVKALEEPLSDPPAIPDRVVVAIVGDGKQVKGDDDSIDSVSEKKSSNRQRNTANDIVSVQLSAARFARPTDASGVTGTSDYLTSDEMVTVIPRFVAELHVAERAIALAGLLAMLLNARPNQFHLVPLERRDWEPCWLDIETGHYCLVLESVIARKKFLAQEKKMRMAMRAPLRVPLPIEVVVLLRALLAANPSATNLAQLFSIDSDQLDRKVKRFVRALSPTSHHVTVERLMVSYGRFVLNMTNDETLASAITRCFDLGTPANLNYWPLRARRIAGVVEQVYTALGFCGQLFSSPAKDTGSLYIDCESELREVVVEALSQAAMAYSKIHNKSSEAQVCSVHNLISTAVFLLLIVVTGHRKAVEAFSRHTIDLELRLAIIGDKRTAPYHIARLVPLPELAIAWLRFYMQWLALMRYRFSRSRPDIARHCDSNIRHSDQRAQGPLFFVVDRHCKVQRIGTKTLRKRFARHVLPENAGRHFLCTLLVDAGHDSAVVMAHAGRGAVGQEAYGARSCLDPMTVASQVRCSIDEALAHWQLPDAPFLSPRPTEIRHDGGRSHIPHAFRAETPTTSPEQPFTEACPFHEFTLVHSRQFSQIRASWVAKTPSPTLGGLALSLVLLDLVIHAEELLAGVGQLLCGSIYCDDAKGFVDVVTQTFGIRRIWIHPATARIAAKLSDSKEPGDVTDLCVQDAVATEVAKLGMPAADTSPLVSLLEWARAYVSLRAPGALRSWWLGETIARTLRPEAVARHRFEVVEHPKPMETFIRRRNGVSVGDFLSQALEAAMTTTGFVGSDEVRMALLKDSLTPYRDRRLDNLQSELRVKYVLYLIDKAKDVKAVSSVARYDSAVLPVVNALCRYCESIDDLGQAPWRDIVIAHVKTTCTDKSKTYSSERAALNHFLVCFEIDLRLWRPKDRAAPARQYADNLSSSEHAQAEAAIVEMIPAGQCVDIPLGLLLAIGNAPVRWGEVSRLRVCDLALESSPFLVITHAAVGTLKTENAYRVQAITNRDANESLRRLVALRRQQFPDEKKCFLACDSDQSDAVAEVDAVGMLIGTAMWRATGSPSVSIHDARGGYLTRRAMTGLDPKERCSLGPLQLRQLPYQLQVLAGHVDFPVTTAYYLSDFDCCRRRWADQWIEADGLRFSPNFVSGLTNIAADTLSARARRGKQSDSLDVLEGFTSSTHPALFSRIKELSQMVIRDRRLLPADEPAGAVVIDCSAPLRYVALRLTGLPDEVAGVEAQIDDSMRFTLSVSAQRYFTKYSRRWFDFPQFSAAKLRESPFLDRAIESLAGWRPLPEERFIIERVLPESLNMPWRFNSVRDVSSLFELWQRVSDAGICVVSAHDRSCKSLAEDRAEVLRSGIAMQKSLSHRNFGDPRQVIVSFVPADAHATAIPRVVGWTTFQVAGIAWAALLAA